MKDICIIFLTLIVIFSGCAGTGTREEMSSQELEIHGMHEFEKEHYRASIEYFEKLRDWYPFSKYSVTAELKIADAYYNLGEYQEALAEYELFQKLHPSNKDIPYVIYQTGYCYFQQLNTVDRDQTSAHKALSIFMQLKTQFPETDYAHKTDDLIKECRKSIAGHDLYVGIFYYKSKHYKGALGRFMSVVNNYSDIEKSMHEKALHYIDLCEKSLAKPEKRAVKQK
jgi:outer membrane protein assembly factor BamD